jgi:hypothetical protein
MIMKHARSCDEITGPTEEPDIEHYIDDLWQWLQDKLGDGFEGLFQGDEMSPSGRFDRIGKDNLKGFTRNLYENKADYHNTVNDKWNQVDDDDGSPDDVDVDNFVGEGVTGDLATLANSGHSEQILEFFVIDEDAGPGVGDKKKAPAVGMYKHYMTEYAIQVNGIPATSESPNAEDFVEEWIDWLTEYIFHTEKCIVIRESDKFNNMFVTPTENDVVGWAKELWKQSELFRNKLKDKWGQPYAEQDIKTEGSGSLTKLNRPDMGTRRKKKGQVKIGDYT